MPRWLLLLVPLGLLGCPKAQTIDVDHSLPDGESVIVLKAPVAILEEAASDPDPTPRARALGLLILVSEAPAGGVWGARALGDPDPWVQRRAMDALSQRIAEPASAALLATYASRADSLADPYVRGAAALRVARAGKVTPELREAISGAWRAETEPWKQAPLALAAAVLGDRDALAPLGAAIRRGEVALEVEFVLDLGRSGLTELVPSLREGAGWVEDEMRLPYAVAQVALGDSSGEGALRKALSSSDAEIQLEALDYLSRIDDPTVSSLLRRTRDQGIDLVRWYAELALVARGHGAPEQCERAMLSADRDVRALAVRFAVEAARDPVGTPGRRAQRVARRVVREALSDPDPEVRSTAFQAMVALGFGSDEEGLQAGLTDEYLGVRVEAAGAVLLLAKNTP